MRMLTLGLVASLIGLGIGASEAVARTALAKSKAVVVMTCELGEGEGRDPILVSRVSATRGAPDVESGDECAEALGRVLGARFGIEDVSTDGTTDVVYTLVR